MEVRLRRASRLPTQISPRFLPAFNTIEICPPDLRRIKLLGECADGNGEFSRPAMGFLIENHRALHPAFQVRPPAGKYVEIDPHSVGTGLEFLIEMLARWIGLEKRFH